ncbi:hypothetical protein [Neobacillus notoginsengisoli]|uniref:hypothetical protein n=1 Tax=Neobacillus notoginsengisoli TaxID=1578198 RepID=UPI001863A4DE|nr:hypothetical protein [Neobacillus notoginsengisoli]
MSRINKFQIGEKVTIKSTDELVTITKAMYVKNMKQFSYTAKENPSTFFFEDELVKIDE